MAPADDRPFAAVVALQSGALAAGVDALDGEHFLDLLESGRLPSAEPVIEIGGKPEAFIEAAESIGESTSPEHCGLDEGACSSDSAESEPSLENEIERLQLFVPAERISIDDVDIGITGERLDRCLDRPRKQEVVAVQVRANGTACDSHALVHSVVHAGIGLTEPPKIVQTSVATQDVECPIGRSAIDHDVLDAWVRLRSNRSDRLLEERGLIQRWGHDRNDIAVGADDGRANELIHHLDPRWPFKQGAVFLGHAPSRESPVVGPKGSRGPFPGEGLDPFEAARDEALT
jgi:hypothetical protein